MAAKKATKKASRTKKYSAAAADKVAKTMHERKHGTLRSGSTGKKVTSKKQAIAIGLSEARRAGKKVPNKPPAKRKSSNNKSSDKRKSSKSAKSS